jgi:glycosyltransferase involved in cell wall biosynthesis
VDAWARQSRVNHVTGDISFVAICLSPERTVVTIPDCGFLVGASKWKREMLKLFWLDLPVKRATMITTISHSVRDEIIALTGCPAEKVRVIPVAVSDQYQRCDKPFNTQDPRILQVGTAPNKNISRLVESLAGIPCTLVIIGVLSAECREQIHRAKIKLENYVDVSLDEMLQQYRQADIVAFASTYEGFGMPIVEANAVGRPVLTSNVCSMPEVAGDAACLVDPLNVDSIRAGILRIITDDEYRQELVLKGYANAKRFDPDTIAEEYLKVYQGICNRQNRAMGRWKATGGQHDRRALERQNA